MTETAQDLHRAFLGALRRVSPSTHNLMQQYAYSILRNSIKLFVHQEEDGSWTASAEIYDEHLSKRTPRLENGKSQEHAFHGITSCIAEDLKFESGEDLLARIATLERQNAELSAACKVKDEALRKVDFMTPRTFTATEDAIKKALALTPSDALRPVIEALKSCRVNSYKVTEDDASGIFTFDKKQFYFDEVKIAAALAQLGEKVCHS